MKLTHEQYVALGTTLLLVACIAGYWFLQVRLGEMRAALQVDRQELARLTAQEQAHDTLVSFLRTTQTERDELATYLPSLDNPTPLLALIEEVGLETGTTVEVEKLQAESGAWGSREEGDTPYLQIALSVDGGWEAIYQFLARIEHLPYVVTLDSVSISENNEGTRWTGLLQLRVLLMQ